MFTFLATFLVLMLVVTGMALGVIFSDRRIKGSCGGIGNVPGVQKQPCLCENPCENKLKRMAEEEQQSDKKTVVEKKIVFKKF